ncbi:MAG: type II secretion system protein GspG [Verrucomicrobiota bacterium]
MKLHAHRTLPENNRTRRLRGGFSLIEILIVIALIATIAGVVILNVDKILGGGNENLARTFVSTTGKTALVAYRLDNKNYPTTEQGLAALSEYLDEDPVDPWDKPYQYRYPGTRNTSSYDLWSLGPDGVESDDDIGNWK